MKALPRNPEQAYGLHVPGTAIDRTETSIDFRATSWPELARAGLPTNVNVGPYYRYQILVLDMTSHIVMCAKLLHAPLLSVTET